MKRIFLPVALLLLGGCATYKSQATAWVPCTGAECNELWARAQTWLATNSKYRIQLVNDNIIQTYGPIEGEISGVAYTVTKQAQGDGTSKIIITGFCSQIAYGGCMYDPAPWTNLLYAELAR